MPIEDFLKQTGDEPLHPRLREWERRLKEPGVKAELALYQPTVSIGLSRIEMILQFTKDGQRLPDEIVAWDDELNVGLVQLEVRAVDFEQEAGRFALGLRAALRKVHREFGDGYFNSVLFALITESQLTVHQEIEKVVCHAAVNSPEAGSSHTMCREMIAMEISGRARELQGPLGYEEDEVKRILVKALARYLDERFSVSTRRQMGLL